jgi:DNA-directed RNA polymerase subunit RPC12/RpoP
MAVRQISPVVCSRCSARYSAPFEPIVDVGQDPSSKARLLQGTLAEFTCPQCGSRVQQHTPLAYHDPAKELAYVLVPGALNLGYEDQQKLIGSLTNQILKNLPTENRKMYLFNPKTFLTMENLVRAILEADGITQEDIERQTSKVKLIEKFLQARDHAALGQLAQEHASELDHEFFEVLTASAQATQIEGNTQGAQALLSLRQQLAQLSPQGREAVKQIDAALGLGTPISREDLLEQLVEAEDDQVFIGLIAAGRPLLDYAFFQQLTGQLEAAASEGRSEEADRLKVLRSRILDANAAIEQQERQAYERATRLLTELLQAKDLERAVRDRLDQIDPFFFNVLSMNIEEAAKQGNKKTAEGLRKLGDLTMTLLQEKLPPEIRLVNRLIEATYPQETQKLLSQNRQLITPQFFEALDGLIADVGADGQDKLGQHLSQVRAQAETIRQGIPAAKR